MELISAMEKIDAAWKNYDAAIESGASRDVKDSAFAAAFKAEQNVHDWYNRWQKLGGTSDIESIVAAEEERLSVGKRTAMQYGDADLGTRCIVSGGDVLEVDYYIDASYEDKNGDTDDLPF
jgi:hypothetical protein